MSPVGTKVVLLVGLPMLLPAEPSSSCSSDLYIFSRNVKPWLDPKD